MEYFLFIDESGDHGLNKIDPGFPVFTLCGILLSEQNYSVIIEKINTLKRKFWGDKKVILHSSDIRKCEKEFQILFNQEIKAEFYKDLNEIISESKFRIITVAIQKDKYIKKYGKIAEGVYEISLSYILERVVFSLDEIANDHNKRLSIVIEKRGAKEDSTLSEHIQKVLTRGTYYVNSDRFKNLVCEYRFFDKKDDIPGLQLADLVAYPISRYVIDPARANPAFDVLEPKFYRRKGHRYGLKIYPQK
ncbi:MAG: DUF3800 domain-containing protein [Chitinophagaceae bacterium]